MAWLALMFPGLSYDHRYPALRVARLALEEAGAEVAPVTYPVLSEWEDQPGFWTDEREQRFFRDIEATVSEVLGKRQPDRVTLVSKSLGSHAIAWALREWTFTVPVDLIWLTPPWGDDEVFHAAVDHPHPSLYVVGLADPANHPQRHQQVEAATGGRTLALEATNHTLEVPGDVAATVTNLGRVADAILETP